MTVTVLRRSTCVARASVRPADRDRRHRPDGAPGRDPRAARPQRRRQDDAAAHARRPGRADRGHRPRRRDRRRQGPARPAREGRARPVQRPSAYQRISGVENLAFFARLHGLRKKAAYARAREVLADVGLADAADDPVNAWSHGMQQRLSVARALLTDPPVLLIDEATHDLDPEAAAHRARADRGARRARHRGAVGDAAARRAARLRRRGDADGRRDRRVPRHGRGARRARRARTPPTATRPSSSRATSRSSGAPHERRRPGRRGRQAPGVRPPRLEDRALLPRGLRRPTSLGLATQVIVFYFVAKLVDPGKLPVYGGDGAELPRVRRDRPRRQPHRRRAAAPGRRPRCARSS